jgi:hypothetical protein
MKLNFKIGLDCIAFAFVLALTCARFTVFGDESQTGLLRVLCEGVDEQLRNVEFKCTYTYSDYVVDTLEEAENFDTSKGRLVIHATGTLAKTKKMTYESFVLDKLETKSSGYLKEHVTVTNPELRACYRKQNVQYPYRTLFVIERKEEERDIHTLSAVEANIPCPLTLGGFRSRPNFLRRILSFIDNTSDKYEHTTDFDLKSNDQWTTIIVHHTTTDKVVSAVYDMTYKISNAYPYPVLTEQRENRFYKYPRDGHEREESSGLKAFDFISLNGGCVLPQKMYLFSKIPEFYDQFGAENAGKWLVSKWESDDMGKEKPKKSDFYIYLDRDPDIAGLALNLCYRLVKNPPEYFDINQYGVRDLQTSSPIESQVDRNSDLTVLIRPAILLIAGFFIVYGIWKKWKTAKRSASA